MNVLYHSLPGLASPLVQYVDLATNHLRIHVRFAEDLAETGLRDLQHPVSGQVVCCHQSSRTKIHWASAVSTRSVLNPPVDLLYSAPD